MSAWILIADSDSDPREGMSDTDTESSFVLYTTPREKYLNVMLKGHKLSRKNVEIGYVANRKRSAIAAKDRRFCM